MEGGCIEPDGLEVLAWVPGSDRPTFLPVMAATRRGFEGEIVEVRTKMGRRVRCTPDHPWVVGDGETDDAFGIVSAESLTRVRLGSARAGSHLRWRSRRVRFAARGIGGRRTELRRRDRSAVARNGRHRACAAGRGAPRDLRRSASAGFARCRRQAQRGKRLSTSSREPRDPRPEQLWVPLGTARSSRATCRSTPPSGASWALPRRGPRLGRADASRGIRHRISWSFHPHREEHLVDEVAGFWLRHGVRASVTSPQTSRRVTISSRLLAAGGPACWGSAGRATPSGCRT